MLYVMQMNQKQPFADAKELNSIWERSTGLIGGHIRPVTFFTTLGIHTWFMTSPIDVVLILDETISDIKTLKPWQIWFWGLTTYKVYEFPAGTIDRFALTVGMKMADIENDLNTV